MAAFRSDSVLDRTTRTNSPITAPSGIQAGDALAIVFEIAGVGTPPVPTPPDGFVLLSDDFPSTNTDGSFVSNIYVYGKLADEEDEGAATYTVTHSSAITGAYMVAVSGAALVDTFTPEATIGEGVGNPATAPGLTTTVDGSLIIWWANFWDPGSVTPPSGSTPTFTNRYNPTSGTGLHAATGVMDTAGATGDKTSVPSGSPWSTGLVAIKAIAGEVIEFEGVCGGRSSGLAAVAMIRALDGRAAGRSSAQTALGAIRNLFGRVAGIARVIGSLVLPSDVVRWLRIDDRTIDGASWEDERTIEGASWEDDRTFALESIAMTKTGEKITDVVIGDDFRVKRTYTDLPTGITISKAWLTAKRSDRLADDDALFQKEITASLDTDGQITDADSTGGSIAMYFDVAAADSADAVPNVDYVYDIQILTSEGDIHTLEKGTIAFIRGVTEATS